MGGGSITRMANNIGYARNATAGKTTGTTCIALAIRLPVEQHISRMYTVGSRKVSLLASSIAKLLVNSTWLGSK
jgi:hypothetical protein